MKVCATPNSISCWEKINFKTAEIYVKKLQKRISVAYENCEYDKVEYLQRRLTSSFYAKALSVKIVSTNRGKDTSGIDGIVWNTSEDKFEAIASLKHRGYKPKPLRRIYIPKADGRLRPLSIPVMKDRAMQTLYKLALDPIAEVTSDKCSFGFRKNYSCKDAISYCCSILSRYPWMTYVLKIDIKSCFDNISHEWIMEHIPMDKVILYKLLKCGYIDNNRYYPTERGVPQGGALSSIICNMTLDGLERMLIDEFGQKVCMVRYADDILVLGTNKGFLVQTVIPVIQAFMSERNLKISEEKATVNHIKCGVSFLGWQIYKENFQIICVPTRKSIDSLLYKIYKKINNDLLYVPCKDMYKSIKPIIRGWLNYYNCLAQKQSLYGVEFEVVSCIMHLTGDNGTAEAAKTIFSKNIYENI
ncbi:MAG: reverse transcriptase N-terminal domain-containing protein [Lachnospiraceae bacterium]|nr:reverse transcriptase N-terminal domain-containing protein [Lachnospiraceae bacterium]